MSANPRHAETGAATGGKHGDPHARASKQHEAQSVQERAESLAASGLDLAGGILTLRGGRAVVMTEDAYVLLLQIIYEHAPHILKYAFYDMGYRVGVDIAASLLKRDQDPEDGFNLFLRQYAQAGYGQIEVISFDLALPEVRLRGHNLFEAGLAPKTGIYRSPRVVDHYSRGMLAGFLSRLLEREIVCEEVACQYRGDPDCEFVVLPFQE